ncbi:7527_t:CDS:2 [Ambispora leptoticha]|uniref:7527_t:CDS:1 n=1 Tax=Ambispora leptoticha TaxID=144679 RepID=A0A9N9DIJ8_9GLOM|nr:7527_t:CDS:2 [Ambispora leptoticha]
MSPQIPSDPSIKKLEKAILALNMEGIRRRNHMCPLDSEVSKSFNEGTYQSTVIVLAIRAVLRNLPFRTSSFISTSERQSVAGADRKGDGQMGRRPDIMLAVSYGVKLTIDYIGREKLLMDKDQFGIVGIQIAGDTLHLNVLIRDKVNIHKYYHIQSAKIPVRISDEDVVTNFVETLLLLRNIIITNLSLLYHAPTATSQRQMEDSTIVSTPRDDY